MRTAAIGIVLGTAAAVGLAGCGGTAAIWCPTTSRPQATGQSKANSPAPASFNANVLLGRTLKQANATATRHGCTVRMLGAANHLDYRPNRVDLTISDGIVNSVGVY